MVAEDVTIEDTLGDEDLEENIPFKYSITSYGADYPVDGLVKRIKDGGILIPPFQRSFVWRIKQASRFVESLLLGLPVPGIFLSKEADSQKLLVIDGQQRLRTLEYFCGGVFGDTGKQFKLTGVQKQFDGATYAKLDEEDRRRFDDSILHATIVKQEEPSRDDSSIYHIFERLNTGGTYLQPQEIRACIYHGEFNDVLVRLNFSKSWRATYGGISPRMRDQELILRFLALCFSADVYSRPMKEFLNSYMGANRHLELQSAEEVTNAFIGAIDVCYKQLGKNVFKPKRALNAAVFDAVMVGVARRLMSGEIADSNSFRRRHKELMSNDSFITATETATADEENVGRRLRLATEAFRDVE